MVARGRSAAHLVHGLPENGRAARGTNHLAWLSLVEWEEEGFEPSMAVRPIRVFETIVDSFVWNGRLGTSRRLRAPRKCLAWRTGAPCWPERRTRTSRERAACARCTPYLSSLSGQAFGL